MRYNIELDDILGEGANSARATSSAKNSEIADFCKLFFSMNLKVNSTVNEHEKALIEKMEYLKQCESESEEEKD